MITFTVPEQICFFIRSHQKMAYSVLFAASSQALKKLAQDTRHVGGDLPGFYGVLHTWGRQLQYHPYIHYVVAGCALEKKDRSYHRAKNKFYLPVVPLGIIYKAKFKDLMKTEGLFDQIPAAAWKPSWNVNCQPFGEESDQATKYLAAYVLRVAVSDSRIKMDKQTVLLIYKKKKSNRPRTMKFTPAEFIRRFLQHVLPKGFMKIRYYGFMHPSCAVTIKEVKAIIAKAIGLQVTVELCTPEPLPEPTCKHCGGTLIFSFLFLQHHYI